ncbi:VWA domain-containing protein [Roseibacillus persicicus]|uniref:Aerotolerance protein BatA n=1 Tax=Roseibacillus persicicus TaxID=454148 RepID=A0A918TUA7_9BACT|nr:VWA domain-containing protein [Roseibacillus persicicus]MDQ8189635.1 VWA domain-containing protein [Roseibacillus persicicus]GHC59258.1 aerotolerance protein BatA [Roseibacillus persicicus]
MLEFFQKLSFAAPFWFVGLLVIPALWFLQRREGAKSSIAFSSLSILGSLGSKPKLRPGGLSALLLSLALALCFVALARPQHRETFTARKASGIDILLTLDLSESMNIRDFLPPQARRTIPRISAAKLVLKPFIRHRPNDRMGLVIFSGQPYPVCPLTLDHDWLQESIERVQINDITEQGTAIGSAIAAAATRLDARDSKSKIIVLITDGASNSGKLSPKQAAELAAELGIKIYTIAIGTEDGRVGRNVMSIPRQEFDVETLQEIARVTGGEFFRAKNFEALEETFSSIDKLEKSEARVSSTVQETDFYPWVCGLAALLAFAAYVVHAIALPPQP